jgi:translocation and assembly module TamA
MVSGEVLNRRVNRLGHRLRWETLLSPVEQSSNIEYRLPGKRPATDWYSLFTGYQRRRSDALESEGWHGGVRRGSRFNSSWYGIQFLEFSTERLLEDGNWREQRSVVPGASWTLRTGPADPRPRRGLKATLELAGASSSLLSDTNFLRAHLTGKTILPLGDRTRLLVRGELGYLPTQSFDKVPPSWRFYAGGDASVRGYGYQSLGPSDDEGNATGGSRLLTGSFEADRAVTERWSAAAFVDAGSLSRDDFRGAASWSFGVGARWYSPLGPIRLDLAFPQDGDDAFRIHISLGPDL